MKDRNLHRADARFCAETLMRQARYERGVMGREANAKKLEWVADMLLKSDKITIHNRAVLAEKAER